MSEETKKEVEKEQKKDSLVMGVSFTRWLIRALVGGICTVSLYLNDSYKRTIRKHEKTNESQAAQLDSCYKHRFQEMTGNNDRDRQQIRELREENKARIDSIFKLMQKH